MLPKVLQGRLRLPALAAPMFLVSGPELVTQACRAGVLGAFPSLNQRTVEGFEGWLREIRERLGVGDAPYAVQLNVHPTNPRLAADLSLTIRYQVPVLITALGVTREITDAVHGYGGLVFHDATTVKHAVKALDANVDGIIAVCGGAGGHAGSYNPFAFASELRPLLGDKCLILAGAMSNGQSIAGAIAAGADLVSLGTVFINTTESMASEEMKQMIIESTVQDIVYTAEVSGIPASFLRKTLTRPFAAPEPGAGFNVDKEIQPKLWKDIWSAGQGVGGIDRTVPTSQLIARLTREYRDAIHRLSAQPSLLSAA